MFIVFVGLSGVVDEYIGPLLKDVSDHRDDDHHEDDDPDHERAELLFVGEEEGGGDADRATAILQAQGETVYRLGQIEACDACILASPTNCGAVTALFKRFMERLVVYGYWPWGKPAPVFRRAKLPQKPAIIISSCAAPALMGRLSYGTNKNLKVAAKTMGAKVVGSIVTGLIAQQPKRELPKRTQRRARKLAPRLVA